MLAPGKTVMRDPTRVLFDQVLDGQREVVAGHPVLRQTADRLSQSRFRTRAAWTKFRPAPAFWIGVLIGLLLVGFVFTMS